MFNQVLEPSPTKVESPHKLTHLPCSFPPPAHHLLPRHSLFLEVGCLFRVHFIRSCPAEQSYRLPTDRWGSVGRCTHWAHLLSTLQGQVYPVMQKTYTVLLRLGTVINSNRQCWLPMLLMIQGFQWVTSLNFYPKPVMIALCPFYRRGNEGSVYQDWHRLKAKNNKPFALDPHALSPISCGLPASPIPWDSLNLFFPERTIPWMN